ncbi:hypothetical protein SNEBB_000771 [Seison nebaliae]|nr:hypothetical protein SNEBB_000771 [Seison nebaliae]
MKKSKGNRLNKLFRRLRHFSVKNKKKPSLTCSISNKPCDLVVNKNEEKVKEDPEEKIMVNSSCSPSTSLEDSLLLTQKETPSSLTLRKYSAEQVNNEGKERTRKERSSDTQIDYQRNIKTSLPESSSLLSLYELTTSEQKNYLNYLDTMIKMNEENNPMNQPSAPDFLRKSSIITTIFAKEFNKLYGKTKNDCLEEMHKNMKIDSPWPQIENLTNYDGTTNKNIQDNVEGNEGISVYENVKNECQMDKDKKEMIFIDIDKNNNEEEFETDVNLSTNLPIYSSKSNTLTIQPIPHGPRNKSAGNRQSFLQRRLSNRRRNRSSCQKNEKSLTSLITNITTSNKWIADSVINRSPMEWLQFDKTKKDIPSQHADNGVDDDESKSSDDSLYLVINNDGQHENKGEGKNNCDKLHNIVINVSKNYTMNLFGIASYRQFEECLDNEEWQSVVQSGSAQSKPIVEQNLLSKFLFSSLTSQQDTTHNNHPRMKLQHAVIFHLKHLSLSDEVKKYLQQFNHKNDKHKRLSFEFNIKLFTSYNSIKKINEDCSLQLQQDEMFNNEKLCTLYSRTIIKHINFSNKLLNIDNYAMPIDYSPSSSSFTSSKPTCNKCNSITNFLMLNHYFQVQLPQFKRSLLTHENYSNILYFSCRIELLSKNSSDNLTVDNKTDRIVIGNCTSAIKLIVEEKQTINITPVTENESSPLNKSLKKQWKTLKRKSYKKISRNRSSIRQSIKPVYKKENDNPPSEESLLKPDDILNSFKMTLSLQVE